MILAATSATHPADVLLVWIKMFAALEGRVERYPGESGRRRKILNLLDALVVDVRLAKRHVRKEARVSNVIDIDIGVR